MKKTFLKILPWGLSVLPMLARAQTPQPNTDLYDQFCPPKGSKNYDPNDPNCIDIRDKDHLIALASKIIGYLRTIFWIFAVAMLIYAAYLFLFSGSSPENIKKARAVLTGAVIGMVLALVATAIPFLIKSLLQ